MLTAVAPASVPAGTPTTMTLAGTNLRTGAFAEWLAPTQTQPTVLEPGKHVNVTSATSATVSLDPGKVKGVGTLTLVSPRGMRASQQITVA